MNRFVLTLSFVFLFICCSENKVEQQVSFCDEAITMLKKSVNFNEEKGMRLEALDTIFTAKIGGTDSLFMVGYKFVLVAGNQKKLNMEYIYRNLHNDKKELLISLLSEESIEDTAKEIQEKTGGNLYNSLFVCASTALAIKGKDIK